MSKPNDHKNQKPPSREIASAFNPEGNGKKVYELTARLTELETVNEEIRASRRAALNMMEDAILAKEALRKSEEKYHSLFDSIDEGFCIIEVLFNENGKAFDYRFLEANPAFEDQTGLSNAMGKTILELAPRQEKFWFEVYGEIALTGEAKRFEHKAEALDPPRWYDVYAFRIGLPEERKVAVVFSDIAERKQHEEQQKYLLKLNDALRSIAEPLTIEETVTRLAMDQFATDRCYYGTIEGENSIIRRDARGGDLPSVAGTYPLNSFAIFKKAIDEGRPLVVNDARTTEILDETLRNICIQLQVISFINIPVIKNGEPVGNFCLVQSTPRNWTEMEVRLAEETAERIWAAVERARAEQALRLSEQRLTRMVNVPGVGVLLFDYSGRMLNANDAFLEMFGYSREEFNAKKFTWEDFTPAEYVDVSMQILEQLRSTGRGGPYEKEYFHKNGSRIWMMFVAADLGDGTIAEYAIDVSNRKKAEEDLRESRVLLEQDLENAKLLQQVSSHIIEADNIQALYDEILDAACAIMNSNMASLQVLTPEKKELLLLAWKGFRLESAAFWKWVNADDTTACGVALAIQERIIIPDVEAWELVQNTPDLHHFRLSNIRSIQSTPLISRSGVIVGMLSTHWKQPHQPGERELSLLDVLARQVADLIEQRQAEEALKQRERELARAQEIGHIGGVDIDVANNLTAERSPEYLRLHGLPPDVKTETHEDWLQRVHPDDREKTEKALLDALEGSQLSYESEYRIIRPNDKRVRWIYAKMDIERDEQGKPVRMVGVHIDITRRKAVEKALHESEEREAFLLKLSDALRLLSDSMEIQSVAAALTGDFLRANLVHYAETEGEYVTIHRAWANGVEPIIGRVRHEDYGKELIEGLRSGKTEVCNDVNADLTITKSERALLNASNILAYVAVPLIKTDEWVATFAVHNNQPRNWRAAEIELIHDIAERTWTAVERVKAEDALRTNEEQFRRTIENAPLPVIMYAETGEIMQLSHAFTEVTGLTTIQIPKFENWLKFVFGKDSKILRYHTTNLHWQEKLTLNTEISVMTKTGASCIWNFTVSSPGRLKDGRRFLVGMAIDITERKHVEDALRKSEKRFRTLADALPQIIWTNDAAGKANYFNQRWHDYSGLSFEKSVSAGWLMIVHPDDEPASVAKWKKAMTEGEVFDVEYRLRRHDGAYRWHIGRNVPLKDNYDKVIAWFGSATDIDDLKKAQEALSQSEARLRITMESASDFAIITMDTERKIEGWSSGAAKIFGYAEAEIIGKPADLIFTEEDRQAGAPEAEMQTAKNTGRASDERWHQRKDGTRFFMSGVMAPIYDGALTGYVKVARDMTQQKLLEQQKDEFIGIASHELKTPVTSIKAYTELLKDILEEEGNQEDVQLVTKLDTQVDRLAELIRSLLDTTRIAEGQLLLNPELFDINMLIKERLEELQHTTDNHKLVINASGIINVTADRERIGQVLINLVSNAIKYSPKGGEVIISVEAKADGVEVSIKDKGVGIPPETKDKIFDRFYRVRSAQINTFPGMGLGLYISAAIVKRHGGRIWVESKLNEGSTFYFFLPFG